MTQSDALPAVEQETGSQVTIRESVAGGIAPTPYAYVTWLGCQSCGWTLQLVGDNAAFVLACRNKECSLNGIGWTAPTVPLTCADPTVTAAAWEANALREERTWKDLKASFTALSERP